LARWLLPADYGAFAVGYSIFLFAGAFHTALITEPLLVFGAGKYAARWRGYLSAVTSGHWAVAAIGSLLLAGVGVVAHFMGRHPLAQTFLGLALATPFSLLMWFARRAAYLRFQPQLACLASGGYLVLLLIALLALAALHSISIFVVVVTMGGAGAITGLWLLRYLHKAIDEEGTIVFRSVIEDHWRYGRWAVGTSLLMWVPLNFFFVVLSIQVNFEASATLKALSNLILPLLQTNAALGALLLPTMVARGSEGEQFKKLLRSSLLLFAAGAVLYSLGIGILSRPLVHLLYGNKYDAHANLIWLLLLIPLLDGSMVVLASALRSLARPDQVFRGYLAVSAFVLIAGVLATKASGLQGAASAMIFAHMLGIAVLSVGIFSQLHNQFSKGEALAV
jgi:O-antigen/teichoic acid export membrane protein